MAELPLTLLAVLSLLGPPGAQAGPELEQLRNDSVVAALASGEYGTALELSTELEAELASEWGFHIRYGGGDLAGALRAALGGLERFPTNPRLLENATRCALALGLGERALALALRLEDLDGLDGPTRVRAEELVATATLAADREARARAGVARARWVSAALAAVCACALAWLGSGPRAGPDPSR